MPPLMLLRVLPLLLSITFSSFSSANDYFRGVSPTVFIDAEQALLHLDTVSSQPLNRTQSRWFLLNKAQAQEQLYEYDSMAESLRNLESLFVDSEETDKDLDYFRAKSYYTFLQGVLGNANSAFIDAERFLKASYDIASLHALERRALFANMELANTYNNLEDYEHALTLIDRAYQDARLSKDDLAIAYANQVSGNIYHEMGLYNDSIQYFSKAMDGYSQLNYQYYADISLFGLASGYRYQRKYPQALRYFEMYIEQTKNISNSKSHYLGHYGLAVTLAELPDCERALDYIDKALAIGGPAGWSVELHKKKVRCFTLLGQLPAAEKALLETKQLISRVNDLQGSKWAVELYEIESDLERSKGNYQVAYELMQQYNQWIVSTNSQRFSEKILDMRASQESKRKDIEISLLEAIADKQRAMVENKGRQSQLLFFAFMASMAALILLVIAFVIYYLKSKKIAELSTQDGLTGLKNRRYVFGYLERLLASKAHEHSGFSVLCIDVDDFKAINDQYGHPIGDKVIKHVAEVSRQVLRMSDILGRIGGEEFMYVFPRTQEMQAEEVSHRLLRILRETPLELPGDIRISITVSMGISHADKGLTTVEAIYNAADEAMYRSKKSGKNCLTVA